MSAQAKARSDVEATSWFAGRRGEIWRLMAVSFAATAPVWIAPRPPMADLAQHAAQVQLLRSLGDAGFPFASLFELNWFTPYLIGYLCLSALVPLVGIVAACKTVVGLSLAAVPLATRLVMRETGADPEWAYLTIPGLYGFAYHWGLLNFLVATPIGLLFLYLVMRHLRQPRWTSAFELALMAVALFFCHALICAFFCTVVAVCALCSGRGIRQSAVRLAPLAVVVPVAWAWSHGASRNWLAQLPTLWDLGWFHSVDPYYAGLPARMGTALGWGRLTGLVPRMLGVQPTPLFIALGLLVLALPLVAGGRPIRRAAVVVMPALCLAVLFVVPSVLFGNSYTYQRFTVFLLPFYMAALGSPSDTARGHLLRRALPLVALAWTAAVSVQALAFRDESRGFETVLHAAAPGQRTLGLSFQWQSRHSIAPSFLHFPSWYTAERGGLTDPSFAVSYAPLVRYRETSIPRAGILGFEWQPEKFDWMRYSGGDYRYFLARAFEDPGPFLQRTAPCALRLRAHDGAWWLYERDASCGS